MCGGYELGESKREMKPIGALISFFNWSFDYYYYYYLSLYYFQLRRIFRNRMPCGYIGKQLRRNSLQLQSFDSFCCLTWLQRQPRGDEVIFTLPLALRIKFHRIKYLFISLYSSQRKTKLFWKLSPTWDWVFPSSQFFWQLFYIPTSRKYCNHTLKEPSLSMTLKSLGLRTDKFLKKISIILKSILKK